MPARKPVEERLYKRGRILWVHGFANGKTWNVSTGFTESERDKAIEIAKRIEQARLLNKATATTLKAETRLERAYARQQRLLEHLCSKLDSQQRLLEQMNSRLTAQPVRHQGGN